MPTERIRVAAICGAVFAGPLVLAEVKHRSEDIIAQLQSRLVQKKLAEDWIAFDDIGFTVAVPGSILSVELCAEAVDIGIGAVDHVLR